MRTGLLLAFIISILGSGGAFALTIGERVMSVYNKGEVRFTCLMVDGGAVPIKAPRTASLVPSGSEISVRWPDQKAQATFQDATITESSLIEKDGKFQPQAAWEPVILSQIDRSAQAKALHDFTPGIMPVNHWKMGAIAYDYQLGGAKWSTLLLVWRCVDGTTISVKLFARADFFEEARNDLYQIIGGAMLLKD